MERRLLRLLQNIQTHHHLRQTHLQILVHGLNTSNHLLSNFISVASTITNSTTYPLQIFHTIPSPDVTVHNFTIRCLNFHNRPSAAAAVFRRLLAGGSRPNSYTFTFAVKSWDLLGEKRGGRAVHGMVIRSGFESNLFVGNCVLDFYSKCGGAELARKIFDQMVERDVCSWNSMINAYLENGMKGVAMEMFDGMPERNVVSWNSMIRGLSKAGDMEAARSVFERMATVKKSDLTWNSMISGYADLGEMAAAAEVFDKMVDKTVVSWTAMISGYARIGDLGAMKRIFAMMPVKNVVSWNAMIAGYNQNSRFTSALEAFQQMLIDGKFAPNETTMISVVSSCTQLGALEHGNWIHSYIRKKNIPIGNNLGNALIDMFAKCGDVGTAETIFRGMGRRCIISWTTMISGLGLNGECRKAMSVFEEMCREDCVQPDDAVFIAVLTACTHGGLVRDGLRIFDRMVGEFGVRPRAKHYGCVVDLLCRAGKLKEAIEFVESGTICEPESAVIWATLLGSCKARGKVELVEFVRRKIVALDPLNSGYQVLISNSQASCGRWRAVMEARLAMRCAGIEKMPGCSSIQMGGKVHEFLVKDTRHSMRKEIYEVLDGLTCLLRQLTDNVICIQH